MRDEYTNCRGDMIVYYLITLCMMFYSVQMRLVWGCHKVIFLEVIVVMGLTPLEMMHYLIPPSELVQGGVQQLFIV